jgi:hypothetical protein
MGLKQRLVAGIVPADVVVADSANCIDITNDSMSKEEMLAIINSKLLNWFFKRTSTNNHVNIYELENLPIRMFSKDVGIEVKHLVSEMIHLKSESNPNASLIERGISIQNSLDVIVFDLYGINSAQADLIESEISS